MRLAVDPTGAKCHEPLVNGSFDFAVTQMCKYQVVQLAKERLNHHFAVDKI